MDFCMNRRAEVIDYVASKYGRDNVCQIITFGTMAAKGVIRDVGRSLDIPYAEVDRIAKLIPNELNATIDKALEQEPRLREEMKKSPQIAKLIEIAQAAGRPVAACIHARRRRRDRPQAADGTDSRSTRSHQGRNHDPVQHEGSGDYRPAEDGFPGAGHADGHRSCGRDASRVRKPASTSTSPIIPLNDPQVYKLFAEGERTGYSSLKAAA